MRAAILAILCVFLVPVGGAIALQPNEVLKNSELEARARNLSKDIRCLVCQNQSIDDSNAGLARDLRVLVRERLREGDSDEQILDFLVKRYGDFVLLKPPVKASTYALWYGPIVIFVLGVIGLVVFMRGRRPTPATQPAALSEDEERRISALLDENNQKDG
ncbi:MAG: cytochrome c-type biogenesis protein [Pseudomonadota bacterium]|nr:cytochrome c-type biogenesis protein [Pseudomonadota bacterium]